MVGASALKALLYETVLPYPADVDVWPKIASKRRAGLVIGSRRHHVLS